MRLIVKFIFAAERVNSEALLSKSSQVLPRVRQSRAMVSAFYKEANYKSIHA